MGASITQSDPLKGRHKSRRSTMLNGYKTYAGVMLWGLVNLLMLVMPQYMAELKMVEVVSMTLLGVGVGHKLAKMV